MKILLVGSFEHPMYAPALESGFRELGHEVICVNYQDYLYKEKGIGLLFSRLQSKYHYGLKLINYNQEIRRKAMSFLPDFIFLYRCYNVWPSTIKMLKSKGNFVITYNNDDPFKSVPCESHYRYFKAIIPIADINYVYRKKNIADYENVGGKNIHILLPYYIRNNNYIEECLKDIPISFIGHFENDGRDKYIKAMVDYGLPISVFGDERWKEAPLYEKIKAVVHPSKRGKEYNHTINRSKICLVLFSHLNNDTYTRRCFEIPATRTLMLSEYTDDMDKLFPANECAVYFHNEEELVKSASYLLKHPEEIERIADNAYKRLQELGGSEIDRCQEIVTMVYNRKN